VNTSLPSPRRGEVWLVNLDPTLGAEIKKVRPVVVVSSNEIRKLPLRLIAPITGWKDAFANTFWHVRIDPDVTNGLSKPSVVDTLQLRGVALERFTTQLGYIHAATMEEIAATIAGVVEYS
jgi:mRNA interferase MazF